MSETKISLCLKYKDGRYLSWDSSNFPLTHKLSQARRFGTAEQIASFLRDSYYRPEQYGLAAEDFEIAEIEISYKEREINADSQSGTKESEIAVGD